MANMSGSNEQYTVVARRYRPQKFGDLVGQNHVTQALSNAIKSNRVGHAYLFTGARGVGKTSSARIFAKCLNCAEGPTDKPCNECDICQSVSVGEDVDVLEIDGASNRGIDEIRQLRSNAAVRPGRARFKIYIIDEVHMLTQQAFNALLKTLEEPPGHVKFIFCTTDPQKIPITVLSRCQRFDFSPVQTKQITERLQEIAENENVKADEAALQLLARRAGGSMRDSQSLLEQLFSFCGDAITVEEVHQLLGTADISRIAEIAHVMVQQNSAAALDRVAVAMSDGVDPGQLADQLLGYFRDMMAKRVGCQPETMLHCGPDDLELLGKMADELGLETILMAVQVLDNAVARMQTSLHIRTLLEVAVVRICNLEHLDLVADLAASVQGAKSKLPPRKRSANGESAPKKNEVVSEPAKPVQTTTDQEPEVADPAPLVATPEARETPAAGLPSTEHQESPEVESASSASVTSSAPENDNSQAIEKPVAKPSPELPSLGNVQSVWKEVLLEMDDMTADWASDYEKVELAETDKLVVTLLDSYNRDMCLRPQAKEKFESTLFRVAGRKIRVDFLVTKNKKDSSERKPVLTRTQQLLQIQDRPFIKEAMQVFDAEILDFYSGDRKTKK